MGTRSMRETAGGIESFTGLWPASSATAPPAVRRAAVVKEFWRSTILK